MKLIAIALVNNQLLLLPLQLSVLDRSLKTACSTGVGAGGAAVTFCPQRCTKLRVRLRDRSLSIARDQVMTIR
ncbi:hypothetical protein [Nostoc sp. DedSLP04]|uniref:hypothetical protein n=1 Tax=Nostoc sp. DedSLP04 TaxID=3075401 RepID=UPI002AD31840|nr:hypothetical protein [Nostoc sp. DedSLP04]MDZ8032809.1 hypothetical protein [Nostoc sp. DedSLP04]